MRPTARENGIPRLYHYQAFNPIHLADIISMQRVHCSDPQNLNDPWDCKPWLDESCVENPETRAALLEFLGSMLPSVELGGLSIESARDSLESDPSILVRLIRGSNLALPMLIRDRWAIYCLTPHPDSTLMWAHYAQNHRGICLEFGTESSLFGAAWEVKYDLSYPIWHLHRLVEGEGINILLSKSDDWKYENEYRIIGVREPFLPANSGVQIGIIDDSLYLPPGSLKSVIIGCEANYDAISTVVRDQDPDLPIKRAIRQPNRYRLQIVPPS